MADLISSKIIPQKQAVVNVNGAPSILDGPGAGKRAEPAVAAAKAAQKKVVKPKPKVEVIDLTSDSKKKQHHEPVQKKEGEKSSRRNMPTLTSVLTARSKVPANLLCSLKHKSINKNKRKNLHIKFYFPNRQLVD